jgi:hypothetical protein
MDQPKLVCMFHACDDAVIRKLYVTCGIWKYKRNLNLATIESHDYMLHTDWSSSNKMFHSSMLSKHNSHWENIFSLFHLFW